ncbi:hypothetical protein ABK040_006366 [Willaertia magna]
MEQFKSRLEEYKRFISFEILYEIAKYFDNINDFINLLRMNKFYYNNLLLSEDNEMFNKLFNKIMTCNDNNEYNNEFNLQQNLPNYLFNKLENIIISLNNLQTINKFKNLKSLTINSYSSREDLQKLQFIQQNNLFFNTFINIKETLQSLTFHSFDCKDEDLINLTNLTKLEINCGFSSIFTGKCLKNLKQLKSLQIFNNDSVIDEYLMDLTNLKELIIGNCKKITEICLQNKFKLERLAITILEPTTHFYEAIQKLTNLKYLATTIDSHYIKSLINLEQLIITGNLKDEDFYNLKKLKYLYIKYNSVLNGNCFKYLTNLEELRFALKNVKNLNYLKNIKKLYIQGITNNTTDNDLQNLQNIVLLNIRQTEFISEKCFLQLNNIKTLNIVNFNFTDDKCFINLQNLTELTLKNCNIISEQLLNYLPNINLQKLKIENLSITDEYLNSLSLQKLQQLHIINCKNITGECLLNFNELQDLHLTKTNIEDSFLQHLINVKYLHIRKCPNLVSGKFLLNMKRLKYINLIGEFENKENGYIHLKTTEEINKVKLLIMEDKLTLKEMKEKIYQDNNNLFELLQHLNKIK